jgi:Collagen triple helix repeat (20 copies)
MKHIALILTLLSTLGLAACDRTPVVVNTPPPATVTVPGPAGPAGATGATGLQGDTGGQGVQGYTGTPGATGEEGKTGKTGGSTTVIIEPTPPAPAPTN